MFAIFAFNGVRKRRIMEDREFATLAVAVDFVKANVKGLVHVEIDDDNEAADYFAHGAIYAIERLA